MELSTVMETDINLPFITADNDQAPQMKPTRAQSSNSSSRIYCRRPSGQTKQALADAGVDPRRSTRSCSSADRRASRRLQAIVKRLFGKEPPAQRRQPRRGRRDWRGRTAGVLAGGDRTCCFSTSRRSPRHRNDGRRDDDIIPEHDDSDAQERDLLDGVGQPDERRSPCCRASARWPATTGRSASSTSSSLPPAPRGVQIW